MAVGDGDCVGCGLQGNRLQMQACRSALQGPGTRGYQVLKVVAVVEQLALGVVAAGEFELEETEKQHQYQTTERIPQDNGMDRVAIVGLFCGEIDVAAIAPHPAGPRRPSRELYS